MKATKLSLRVRYAKDKAVEVDFEVQLTSNEAKRRKMKVC